MTTNDGTSGEARPAIDWQQVRERLAAVAAAAEHGLAPAEEKAILRARAQQLARPLLQPETDGKRLELLEFSLAHEVYAIEMSYVSETLPLRDFTPLPCTPPFVLGLISVRSRIVSVIDMKKFFDLPDRGLTDLHKVIIIRDQGMEFGILADSVLGMRAVPATELGPSLPTLSGVREEYLKGITRERTVVLDGHRLLNDRRLIVHEEIGD